MVQQQLTGQLTRCDLSCALGPRGSPTTTNQLQDHLQPLCQLLAPWPGSDAPLKNNHPLRRCSLYTQQSDTLQHYPGIRHCSCKHSLSHAAMYCSASPSLTLSSPCQTGSIKLVNTSILWRTFGLLWTNLRRCSLFLPEMITEHIALNFWYYFSFSRFPAHLKHVSILHAAVSLLEISFQASYLCCNCVMLVWSYLFSFTASWSQTGDRVTLSWMWLCFWLVGQ